MKETNKGKPYFRPCSQGGRVIKQRWKVFIESWNNERDKRRERERERYKLTPGIRSSSGTRNSNKLLVDVVVVVLKYLGEEKERERIPLWNGDRASDGLVHSIPENLSVFILALGISLEILHTHTHPFQYESSL